MSSLRTLRALGIHAAAMLRPPSMNCDHPDYLLPHRGNTRRSCAPSSSEADTPVIGRMGLAAADFEPVA